METQKDLPALDKLIKEIEKEALKQIEKSKLVIVNKLCLPILQICGILNIRM